MPHQCTNCGRTFADGSKEMLSGCPDCSGTKFQFRPDGFDDESGPTTDRSDAGQGPEPESVPGSDDPPDDAVSRTVGSAAATVRDLVGGSAGSDATAARPPGGSGSDDSGGDADESSTGDGEDDIIVAEPDPGVEDAAQADARGGLAAADDLPDSSDSAEPDAVDSAPEPAADPTSNDGSNSRTAVSEPDSERADRPDLEDLRRELNEQFESIRVVEPGQYELNLMELYDREEYIIALQEDGRYSIQVPETWRDGEA